MHNHLETLAGILRHALITDQELALKPQGLYHTGICPSCHKNELFVKVEKPFQIKCNRRNKCGFTQKTRERYAHLIQDVRKNYPATKTNPYATAEAYLTITRGFPAKRMQGWFEQANFRNEEGEWIPTVRFWLDAEKKKFWGGKEMTMEP